MSEHRVDVRPAPSGATAWGPESIRWRIGAERWRMLRGLWRGDLEAALIAQHGEDGREELGPGSIAMNLVRNVGEQLSVLYKHKPAVAHSGGEDVFALTDALADARLWSQQTYLQQVVLLEREGLKRVSWNGDGLTFETIAPHDVVARPMPRDPTTMGALRHLMWVPNSDLKTPEEGDGAWVWEWWDIRGDVPEYGLFKHDTEANENLGKDMTDALRGFERPTGYPWKFKDGKPFMPWALYHAEDPTSLWDPYRWSELVDATKDVGCLITQFLHLGFRSAHSLKWAIGVKPIGLKIEGGGRVQRVNAGMTSLVEFMEIDPQAGNPGRVGQFAPAASLTEYMTGIQKYVTLVASVAGIDASHIVRESADSWSGAALTVDRDGKREAQSVYGERFEPSDLDLMNKAAAILNINAGTSLPESGYRITYKALPLAPAEEAERREHAAQMVADGHWSILDAHVYLNPGMDKTEAAISLALVRAEDAALAADTGGTDEDLAKTALNGAQVTAAQAIVESAALGNIPRETAAQMLAQFFQLDPQQVDVLLGPIGNGFAPAVAEITRGGNHE